MAGSLDELATPSVSDGNILSLDICLEKYIQYIYLYWYKSKWGQSHGKTKWKKWMVLHRNGFLAEPIPNDGCE